MRGLSISAVPKRGLQVFAQRMDEQRSTSTYDIYRQFDLGTGGSSLVRANEAKRAIGEVLRRKIGR